VAGDSTASGQFDEFYRATARRTLRYAYALTGELTSAQDLAQESYVRAWQRWRTVSGYDNPESWLRVVLTRLASDRWRHLAVRRRFHDSARPPGPMQPPGEDTVLLTRALRELPLPQRRALALHYLLDLPISQIAAETGASEGTVKSWLARGRTALAHLLATERTLATGSTLAMENTEEHHHA
jgi:RNA polymerase sigma-70 factor (ECF subfamily)